MTREQLIWTYHDVCARPSSPHLLVNLIRAFRAFQWWKKNVGEFA